MLSPYVGDAFVTDVDGLEPSSAFGKVVIDFVDFIGRISDNKVNVTYFPGFGKAKVVLARNIPFWRASSVIESAGSDVNMADISFNRP